MEEKKNGKGIIILVVFLTILVICLAAYIGYDKFMSNEDTNTIVKSTKSEPKEDGENSKETDVYKPFIINESNCITDCKNVEYNLGFSVAGDGVEAWINHEDNTKINVNINRRLLKDIYVYEFNSNEDTYTFEFNKRIQDAFIGHIGQDTSIPMLFVLLEDGSVQKIDLYSKITTGNTSQKELINVKNVIKFYSASARTKGTQTGVITTVLAQTSDGKFYDLSRID